MGDTVGRPLHPRETIRASAGAGRPVRENPRTARVEPPPGLPLMICHPPAQVSDASAWNRAMAP